MRAVMLAAGVGARLGGDDRPPKILLEFGGRTLLRRHIEILRAAGVRELLLVTGYRAQAIEDEIVACAAGDFVRTVRNPDFTEGSIVSLWTARAALTHGGDVLLMDGDVLYDHRMIDALLATEHANCFLMDRDFEPGEEPVKLCIRDGGIVDFEKIVGDDHDDQGESVGFFRFSGDMAARLAACAEDDVTGGRRQLMYEHAIRELLLRDPGAFGFEDVTGLPWIEIDFREDLRRARDDILPYLKEPKT
ncbi:MAG: phosphocholine cytidylyltransferase family protein [Alphaproteobacteria bacterium]